MSTTSTATEKAYSVLSSYVKKSSRDRVFDMNTLRSKLTTVRGLSATQIPGVISKAVRTGLIVRVGETISDNPAHNSGRVGVYTRG